MSSVIRVAVLSALVVAGCSSSGEEEPAGSAPAATENAPADTPVDTGASDDADTAVPATDVAVTTAPEQIENAGSVVVVARAARPSGAAVAMTEELAAVGFETGPATAALYPRTSSIVYFTDAEGAEADAGLVAEALGGVDVEPLPDPIPTEDRELDGDVLVVLGANEVGQSLASLNP